MSKNLDIEDILMNLPAHLKAGIAYYLYKEAIDLIKILQNRDQRFYAHFILQFEPMRIKAGTNFVEAGTKPLEVFFLL